MRKLVSEDLRGGSSRSSSARRSSIAVNAWTPIQGKVDVELSSKPIALDPGPFEFIFALSSPSVHHSGTKHLGQ